MKSVLLLLSIILLCVVYVVSIWDVITSNKPIALSTTFTDTTEYYIVHYGRNMRKKQVCDSYYTTSDSTLLVYNGSYSIVIKQPYIVGVYERTR